MEKQRSGLSLANALGRGNICFYRVLELGYQRPLRAAADSGCRHSAGAASGHATSSLDSLAPRDAGHTVSGGGRSIALAHLGGHGTCKFGANRSHTHRTEDPEPARNRVVHGTLGFPV